MILQQFPDLQWLKTQIVQRFVTKRGYDNTPLPTTGFPSVIINTKVKQAWRPNVTGPISLFLNLQGTSRCKVDNHEVEISEEFYFISNRFQPYSLAIESPEPVQTFNVHIGEQFSEEVLAALMTPADKLLNNGPQVQVPTIAFYNRLYRKDERFYQLIKGLQESRAADDLKKLLFEERMEALLVHLLQQHRGVLRQAESLPAIKHSTRLELYRRLTIAVDHIHSQAAESPDLAALAASACLSKFHFLRIFRQVYGRSPYQYLQEIRMEKARKLLKDPSLAVQDIALTLGFENSNSFSRLFRQRTGLYPSQYRLAIN